MTGAARVPVARTASVGNPPSLETHAVPTRAILALAAWGGLIAVAYVWARAIQAGGRAIHLGAPPLVGTPGFRVEPWMAIAVVLAAATVAGGPALADRLGWRPMVLISFATAAAWAVALALGEGPEGLIRPLGSPHEYLRDVPLVGSPGSFLSSFVDRIDDHTTHVRAHPPGLLLTLWGMDRVGLSGPWPAAALLVTGGAAAVPATLVALREVAGEARARSIAPFLVLAPAAVWVATSADALFAGVSAWGAALVVLASGRTPRSDAFATGGGVLLGLSAFLSYGMVLVASVPMAVATRRRRVRPLIVAAAGATVVAAAFGLAGFWWPDGLAATRREYAESIARLRPYGYFLIGNLAAFAVATGPAVAAGLARLRDRRVMVLVAGGCAAVVIADLTGLSKGEVERIWLPFVPWVAVATCALPAAGRRGWLAAQAAVGLAVQAGVMTPW
ncbi:MAG: hypothetical protein ACRDH8_00450 [Actinomycetota bacterium]